MGGLYCPQEEWTPNHFVVLVETKSRLVFQRPSIQIHAHFFLSMTFWLRLFQLELNDYWIKIVVHFLVQPAMRKMSSYCYIVTCLSSMKIPNLLVSSVLIILLICIYHEYVMVKMEICYGF